MASSFPLNIETRATTQRNNAESVGATIDNPVNIFECSSDLDSVASDSPYFQPGSSMSAIKLEPGTTAAPAQETSKGTEPSNLIDNDLTSYLEDPEPPIKDVEHVSEVEPPSAISDPPTAGGSRTRTRMQLLQDCA